MGLLDWFKPKLVIADAASLASFLETRAAFLVQKCTWEYARARAATNSEKLFREEEFSAAVNLSCWSNLPHCLTHEAQMVEGVLRGLAGADRQAMLDGLIRVARDVIARQRPIDVDPAAFFAEPMALMETRLRLAGLAAVQKVNQIPDVHFQEFFDRMPLHEEVRKNDFAVIRNTLRATLVNHHDAFIKDARLEELVQALIALGQAPSSAG